MSCMAAHALLGSTKLRSTLEMQQDFNNSHGTVTVTKRRNKKQNKQKAKRNKIKRYHNSFSLGSIKSCTTLIVLFAAAFCIESLKLCLREVFISVISALFCK